MLDVTNRPPDPDDPERRLLPLDPLPVTVANAAGRWCQRYTKLHQEQDKTYDEHCQAFSVAIYDSATLADGAAEHWHAQPGWITTGKLLTYAGKKLAKAGELASAGSKKAMNMVWLERLEADLAALEASLEAVRGQRARATPKAEAQDTTASV